MPSRLESPDIEEVPEVAFEAVGVVDSPDVEADGDRAPSICPA